MLWKPVWFFSCNPKNNFIFSFGYLKRTLAVSKVLGGFFFSSEAVSYLDRPDRIFEDME